MSDEEKKFLERPLAVVALVGGVVGVLGTGVAIYVSLAGLAAGQPTSADPTARVTDCIKAHGLEYVVSLHLFHSCPGIRGSVVEPVSCMELAS